MTEKIDNWLLGPAGQCVAYLTDEVVYSGLLRRGLTTMSGMLPLFALADSQLEQAGLDTAPLKRIASEYLSWENKAKEQIESGFSTVHRHSLVGLWCAVETAVEDSVVLILERSPQAAELLTDAGYKVKVSPLDSPNEEQLRRVYSSLERQARDRGNIAEAWMDLLAALDVKFSLSAQHISAIAEANEVRNCILHRGGEIDGRAASRATGLKAFVGQRIKVDETQYLGYYDALGAFAVGMITGVTTSHHCKWQPPGGYQG